jgi:hypothetical protein
MAMDHDARLLEVVEELGGDRVRGPFRELLQRALQELIDTELTAHVGAQPHERTETRTNRRNGTRSRVLSTPAGVQHTSSSESPTARSRTSRLPSAATAVATTTARDTTR